MDQQTVLLEEYADSAARDGFSLDSIITGLEDRFACSSVVADTVAWEAYTRHRDVGGGAL